MAYAAMRSHGFRTELSHDAKEELHLAEGSFRSLLNDPSLRDMRSILWSSIDNRESRDLDQIEYTECLPNGEIRVLLAIADVDALVPRGSALDDHAISNATSVYTGIITFPMLPDGLSEGITSLLPGVDRIAVVTELVLDRDGTQHSCGAYRAIVRNHGKLVYERIGRWLEKGAGAAPPEVEEVPGLEEQLRLQEEAMERLSAYRQKSGALNLETIEARPLTENGKIVGLEVKEENPARQIIEDIMVAANHSMAEYLNRHGSPSIQRVVREPEQWPRIVKLAAEHGERLPDTPDSKALAEFLEREKKKDLVHYPDLSFAVVKLLGAGEYEVVLPGEENQEHFGLAVHGYARSTAPNRRYTDLVTQRLLKAVIAGEPPPYSVEELQEIAEECRDRESNARKVERLMRKAGAAMFLHDRIGQTFRAIVTGATPKGTYARLIDPPAEGRIVRREEGLQVGDKVTVRLIGTDPERGFIDFERA
jgi:exoribonuclease-2